MHPDIARLDVSNRRRSLIGYCLGMAVYTLVVVAMYPAFKTSTSLDKLIASDSTAAALFGVTGPISTSGGWLNGNIYANFFPLIMLMLTIGYGAACLASQDEDGTLGLLAVLPVRRTAIVAQKAAAMAVQAALLAATVAALVIIGRSFQLNVTVTSIASVSAAIFPDGPGLRPGHGGRRGADRETRNRHRHRDGARGRLLPHQLARAGGLLDPAGTVRIPVLLVGREQPDQRRRQPRRLRGPDRDRPVRPRRGHPRIPPARHPLTGHPRLRRHPGKPRRERPAPRVRRSPS